MTLFITIIYEAGPTKLISFTGGFSLRQEYPVIQYDSAVNVQPINLRTEVLYAVVQKEQGGNSPISVSGERPREYSDSMDIFKAGDLVPTERQVKSANVSGHLA